MADIERLCDDLHHAVTIARVAGELTASEWVELREFIELVRTGEVYD